MDFTLELKQLNNLTELTKPVWGIMSPQHMVEHLIQAVQLSNGNLVINECMTPKERLPLMKRILMSTRPLPKNFVNTVIGQDVKPLIYSDLQESKTLLKEEMEKFEKYFEINPEDKPNNPTFGPLNKEEWMQFHKKHLLHHFTQFGLV